MSNTAPTVRRTAARAAGFAGAALGISIAGAFFTAHAAELSFHVENTAAAAAEIRLGVLFAALATVSYALAAWLAKQGGAPRWVIVLSVLPLPLGLIPLALAPDNAVPYLLVPLTVVAGLAACTVNLILRLLTYRLAKFDKSPDQR